MLPQLIWAQDLSARPWKILHKKSEGRQHLRSALNSGFGRGFHEEVTGGYQFLKQKQKVINYRQKWNNTYTRWCKAELVGWRIDFEDSPFHEMVFHIPFKAIAQMNGHWGISSVVNSDLEQNCQSPFLPPPPRPNNQGTLN